jgi:MerR family transcriptional regulator/heat shock protein HspR
MAEPRSDDRRTRAVYVISVAAELAGVHPQTLRIYERKGLI